VAEAAHSGWRWLAAQSGTGFAGESGIPRIPTPATTLKFGAAARGPVVAYGHSSRATAAVTGSPSVESCVGALPYLLPLAEQGCQQVQGIPRVRLQERPGRQMSFWTARALNLEEGRCLALIATQR
jgi:hypothetical protein